MPYHNTLTAQRTSLHLRRVTLPQCARALAVAQIFGRQGWRKSTFAKRITLAILSAAGSWGSYELALGLLRPVARALVILSTALLFLPVFNASDARSPARLPAAHQR